MDVQIVDKRDNKPKCLHHDCTLDDPIIKAIKKSGFYKIITIKERKK